MKNLIELNKLAEISAGGGAPQESSAFCTNDEGKPFIRAGSLPKLLSGESEMSLEHLTEESAKEYRLRLFPKDTILFAKSGMSATKGHIYQLKQSSYVVNHLAAIVPNKDLFPLYLKYWFQQNPPSRLIKDEAYPSIRLSEISEIKIPLPPLDEQKRIAAVLDKADALREKRRAAITKLDELLQSVFLDMFGDPVSNPKDWEIGTIRDLILSANYGTSEKSEAVGKYPVLRMNNITYQGGWDFSSLKYSDFDKSDVEKYLVKKGELLFNRTNSKELVGKTAVFRANKPMAFAGYLIRVRTNSENNTEYISAFLNSGYGKTTLMNMCKNIIGMANINAQELQNIRIPKPPTELQNRFANIVQKVEEMKVPHQNNLQTVETLFQSLQQRAFAGELFGAANDEINLLKNAAAD